MMGMRSALLHMNLDDSVRLATDHPAITLWIAGLGTAGPLPHDVQLVSGTHVISTPGTEV